MQINLWIPLAYNKAHNGTIDSTHKTLIVSLVGGKFDEFSAHLGGLKRAPGKAPKMAL
jgi:hypothetical protein